MQQLAAATAAPCPEGAVAGLEAAAAIAHA